MKRKRIGRFSWLIIGIALLAWTALAPRGVTLGWGADPSVLRIKVGGKAPDFDLAAADGKRVKLSDFTGHKVLLDFYRGYW